MCYVGGVSGPKGSLSRILRWSTVAFRILGAATAAWAALELLSPESRGSHVLGRGRWPTFVLAVVAITVTLTSVLLDLLRPSSVRADRRILRDMFVVVGGTRFAMILAYPTEGRTNQAIAAMARYGISTAKLSKASRALANGLFFTLRG